MADFDQQRRIQYFLHIKKWCRLRKWAATNAWLHQWKPTIHSDVCGVDAPRRVCVSLRAFVRPCAVRMWSVCTSRRNRWDRDMMHHRSIDDANGWSAIYRQNPTPTIQAFSRFPETRSTSRLVCFFVFVFLFADSAQNWMIISIPERREYTTKRRISSNDAATL